MPLVFAAIAPHGGIAVAEACAPGEREVAAVTRAGLEELGHLFTSSQPDVVIVATPHNVHIANALGVIVASRVAGRLNGVTPPVRLDGLVEIERGLVEDAQADSWWQMLMLHGATPGWHGTLLSYEAPTYFGMLTAVYVPS